jgi:hypothetical protein
MVPILTLLLGIVAMIAGKYARRTVPGGPPRCANCEYDLRVRNADSSRCPECGADLKVFGAIKKRIRQRIPGAFAGGLAACVLSAWMAWSDYGDALIDHATSTDSLLAAVQSDRGRDFITDVQRIARRIDEQPKRVDARQRQQFIESLINVKMNQTAPWFDDWTEWIDDAVNAGVLNETLRDRYLDDLAREMLQIKSANPGWGAGAPLNVVVYGPSRGRKGRWMFRDVGIICLIDGKAIAWPGSPNGHLTVRESDDHTWFGGAYAQLPLTSELRRQFGPGTRTLTVQFTGTLIAIVGVNCNVEHPVNISRSFPITIFDNPSSTKSATATAKGQEQ